MIQAEKKVIGCLVLEPETIADIRLEPYMFEDELYRDIFREYLRLYENHKQATDTVIEQALVSDQRPSHYLRAEMAECAETVATTVEIKPNAEIIRNEYIAKQFGEYLNVVKPDPSRIMEQIGDLVYSLESLRETRETTSIKASDMVKAYKDQYFTDRPEGVRTGFEGLDETLGDLDGGDVIIIGARPSVGKSALATQIATNIVKQGKRVGFYNLEMSDKQIYERLLASASGIGLNRIRRALAFTGDEKERFERANDLIEKNYSGLVITTGSKRVSDIRAESRHMDYDVIIIDYMQLLLPEDRYKGNRFAEVGQISRDIKALATELKIPIIALSQLNRVSELKETKEPTMAELRESGSVEQDASIIILMWNLDEDRIYKGLKVDKSRQGKVGKEKLKFEGSLMQFIEDGTEWEDAKDEDIPVFK